MAQHDYVISNASGATVRADINSALSAIQTLNSGTSAPSSTAAGMLWLDTTGGAPYALKVRDAGNNHWLTLASVTDPGADGNLSVAAIEGTNVLSTGESGGSKFLREDGDGSCSFQSVATNFEFISKSTASSSATIEFTNLSNYSTYKNLYFIVNDMFPSTENAYFRSRIATSGTTYLSSNYLGILNETYSNGSSHTTSTGGSTSGALFYVGGVGTTQTDGNATESDIGIMGTVMLFSPNDTIGYHSAMGDFLTQYSSGYISRVITTGKYYGSKSPLTAIKFEFSTGNIASGSIAMYGVKDA